MNQITVKIDTYLNIQNAVKELRNKYYSEQEINDKLSLNANIVIVYYGLTFKIEELDDIDRANWRMKSFFKDLSKQYNFNSPKHKEYVYRPKPGQKKEDVIRKAVDSALWYIVNHADTWTRTKFAVMFNGVEYEFNPTELSVLTKMRKEII